MRRGLISGYVLKLARESIPASQERLATVIGVDRGTIQGWETARRPLMAIPYGQVIAVRHTLTRLGANHHLVNLLDDAADADFLMGAIAEHPHTPPAAHPLGHLVLTHRLTDLIGWAATGQTPSALPSPGHPARRGPVPTGPSLDPGEVAAFFDGLRIIADQAHADDPSAILAHRQACFLAGLNPGEPVDWLAQLSRSRYFTGSDPWTPQWADSRSVATALARHGDTDPLRDFISHAHADHLAEVATLNYSAYWAGETPGRQHTDTFMTDPDLTWGGTGLLRHLVDRLTPGPFVDLTIHTTWLLLIARRHLLDRAGPTTHALADRTGQLLDTTNTISPQSRTELTSIHYQLRVEGITA